MKKTGPIPDIPPKELRARIALDTAWMTVDAVFPFSVRIPKLLRHLLDESRE